ncbi:MAG: hypothetical protein KAI83_01820 [Thiomargarita sp.]|nr:hypothetical protein [Thiomargarita sp.]
MKAMKFKCPQKIIPLIRCTKEVLIMIWSEVRQAYHNQWLIIEALHTTPDTQRHDHIAIVEMCKSGGDAMLSSSSSTISDSCFLFCQYRA